MPSHLNIPAGNASLGTTGSSITAVEGTLSFTELEGKDQAEQLEILITQLSLEERIREGAENFLNMDLAESLRLQVQSELEISKKKIEAIKKRIEAISKSKAKQTNSAIPTKRRMAPQEGGKDSIDKGAEDFRTALHNASIHLKELASLTSHGITPASSSNATPNSMEADRQLIETISKLIDILQRNLRVRYDLKSTDVLRAVLPFLGDRYSKQARAAAYRLVRHSLVDAESVKVLNENESLDWYIVKSLNRDNKHSVEKEQAVKLIRTMVEIGKIHPDTPSSAGTAVVPLSEPIVRALIAIAEQPEDPFRLICIETLAEILLIDIDLVSRTGGIRLLLHLLGDGPPELSPLIAATFLHIVDSPRTRIYLRVGMDLELALAAVTDAYGKGPEHADRMRSCIKVIQSMLRTWSGMSLGISSSTTV
ncbi:hypothetical protein H0H81_007934 [Sphagnurus paluster]|uniref:Rapamycin-insensitive companion of mTOR N-terminal domain-containing protein n=1 Tax=Sphagnurus paluster TaxID=117069 RepID=A0A9P7GJ86_9AGAR|nr:hypothetical protein H0H81_007934 [Sphagnurus paluster]